MVMVLEQSLVEEMERIGKLRHPNEACGLLLPEPHRGRWVWEMPNRSLSPRDSFRLLGEDMVLTLEGYFPEPITDQFLESLTVWHTHPSGNLGPSASDLEFRPKYFKNLVITIYEDAPAKATWF